MESSALLAAFDEQVRIRPEAAGGSTVVEREDGVVRVMDGDDGWIGVTFSDLAAETADEAIAAQVRRFAELDPSAEWEWKHYSHDRPTDLPQRLRAAGLIPGPAEALLVARIADLGLDDRPPSGVELIEVQDQQGIDALVSVHEAVFGGDHTKTGRALAAQIYSDPPPVRAVLAVAGGLPVSSGRIEFTFGTDFASLWGGGTLPAWRGRGIFRALVAHRAALAAEAGFRYLQVDASADSQPILRRLGFIDLATTTPFTFEPRRTS
jgi:ribosomal protein S18 acetylase RimI-like enzyme